MMFNPLVQPSWTILLPWVTTWQTTRSLKETAPRSIHRHLFSFSHTARVLGNSPCGATLPSSAPASPHVPLTALENPDWCSGTHAFIAAVRDRQPQRKQPAGNWQTAWVPWSCGCQRASAWLPQGPSPPSPGFRWSSFHREDGWPV